MNCESAMIKKKRLKKNLNSLYSTVGTNVKMLYFWLFSLLDRKLPGNVVPLSSILRLWVMLMILITYLLWDGPAETASKGVPAAKVFQLESLALCTAIRFRSTYFLIFKQRVSNGLGSILVYACCLSNHGKLTFFNRISSLTSSADFGVLRHYFYIITE